MSDEERDYIEETIEIILAEFEEFQVRIQFREDPDVAKKISDSLQATAASRRTRVGHIAGIPAASSELFVASIPNQSSLKATKTDQEFYSEAERSAGA